MEPPHESSPNGRHGLGGPVTMSDATRRDLLRANTAVAVVLTAVLVLALVAVFAGLRAARNQRRAEAAEATSQERLRNAFTEEARAIRVSAEAGGRVAAMAAISNAVSIRPSPELRTEAIACLALSDLVQEGPLVPSPREMRVVLMDAQLHYFAYGDPEGNVLVHSLTDGSQLFSLNAADLGNRVRRPVNELLFSPDDTYLAARYDGGAVVVWNLASRRHIFANAVSPAITNAAQHFNELQFSGDSKQIIFCDVEQQGQISVYDLPSGERAATGVNVWSKTFRMRGDLKQVAVASDTTVEILDFPSGVKRSTLTHSESVEMIEWSPDGKRLAVTSAAGDVDLWEPARDVHWQLAGHSERCIRLGFNADGTLLFSSARDGTTRLWDVAMGRMIAVGAGLGCTFTPDGQRIGFWRAWEGFGAWRVSPSSVYAIHACDKSMGPLLSIDLSPSGRWCVVTQRKGFRIWDLANGDRDLFVPLPEFTVRVAMDEQSLLVCNLRGLERWPLATNAAGELQLSPTKAVEVPLPGDQPARAVALSQNGRWAAVELMDHRLLKLDLAGSNPPVELKGRWRHFNYKGPGSPTGAGRFVISPDGRWVVTGFDFDGDGPMVWDGNTGELACKLPVDTSLAAFSADGRWLGLAGMDRNTIWSAGDWQRRADFAREEASLVHGSLAFLPDSSLIAMSRTRQTVELCDWQSGTSLCDLISPAAESVNSVRLSSDGQTLVMATASDMVEVWHLGLIHQQLAAMHLDWTGPANSGAAEVAPELAGAGGWQVILLVGLGGFALVVVLALFTLRRHRLAIERFVIAEAQAAESNRALDIAKVELMHSQKMQALGTLATGIAHDFNNLLSVVRMSGKLIGRQAPGDKEIQEHVTDIEQAVLQGKNVVSSVLGYARAEKESGQPTDVSAVVEEAVSLLSREFLQGIALTLELERGAPRVDIARGPLDQVFLNLLVNASEAMQGRGRLKIAVRTRDAAPVRPSILRPRPAARYVELSVLDSGPGISPEIQGRIFEPFFTTKRSATKAGTGLGLSLVYTIAQQAGLGLSVESEPGRGAQFSVVIPAGTDPVRETHSVQSRNSV